MSKKNSPMFETKITVADIKIYDVGDDYPNENLMYKGPKITYKMLCLKIGKILRKISKIVLKTDWNVGNISPYIVSISGTMDGGQVGLPSIIPTSMNTYSEIHIFLTDENPFGYSIDVHFKEPDVNEKFVRSVATEVIEDMVDGMDIQSMINGGMLDMSTMRPQGKSMISGLIDYSNVMIDTEASFTAESLKSFVELSKTINSPIITASQVRIQEHEQNIKSELIKYEILKQRLSTTPVYTVSLLGGITS